MCEELESRDLLCGAYGDLDPVPKTMTIDVLPHPDANRDGIVNGQDLAAIAGRWGEDDGPNRLPIGGLHLATIASYWLQQIEPALEDFAADVATAEPQAPRPAGGMGGVEVHLAPIYPPLRATR